MPWLDHSGVRQQSNTGPDMWSRYLNKTPVKEQESQGSMGD